VKLDDLAKRAKAHGMRAVALTDHANMYGAIRHYNSARANGLTPIIGCEVNVVRKDASAAFDHLVLLAATNEGYKNLIRLVSEGHLRSASAHGSAISRAQIAERSKGLIALTGCLGGVAAQRILDIRGPGAALYLGVTCTEVHFPTIRPPGGRLLDRLTRRQTSRRKRRRQICWPRLSRRLPPCRFH